MEINRASFRELRIFLLAVGLPAIGLTIAGARLVQIEWRHATQTLPPELVLRAEGKPLPPPPPLHIIKIFSEEYEMNGPRVLGIGCCLLGLMFLSLVSGGWLLMRAARQARLEALKQTDFVSTISHEFKTPLTTICLCAELARDEKTDEAHRNRALDSIASEAERLKRLVLNALDFSRLEKKRYQYRLASVDVADVSREVCATFMPRFAAGGLVQPEGHLVLTVDADAVRQILANLLDNAAKYAAKGPVEVRVNPTAAGGSVEVLDQGEGLSRAALRHAFDRFWRADNAITRETGGSGLGLAIARGLARGMGGDLTARNRASGGAAFCLELPA